MRRFAFIACALVFLGAAPQPQSVPKEWQNGTEQLVVFLEHLENGTSAPLSAEAVYTKNAVQCTKEEFRNWILSATPGFSFGHTQYWLGNFDGLRFEKAQDYVGHGNAAFRRIDKGTLDGQKKVIISHGFLHLHYAEDGRIVSCAVYLQPGTPQ